MAYVAAGFFFGLALPLRLRHRLGPALDRRQASGGEGVDAGALAARIGDDRDAIAARIVGEIDVVGRADAAHHVAFGMAERDASPTVERRRHRRQRIGVGRTRRRRHARTGAVGADEIFRRDRLVRGQRRRLDRNVADEHAAGTRKPVRILRKQVGRSLLQPASTGPSSSNASNGFRLIVPSRTLDPGSRPNKPD